MLNAKVTNTEYLTKNVYTGKLNFMIYDDMTGRKKYIVDQNYSAVEKVAPYDYRLITRSKSDSMNNPHISEDETIKQMTIPLVNDHFIDKLEPITPYATSNHVSKREIENIVNHKNGNKSLSSGMSKVKRLWN